MAQFILMGDNVLLMPEQKPNETAGGIVIPDTADTDGKTARATVVLTSSGSHDALTGEFVPITVKKGDKVVYDRTAIVHRHKEWGNMFVISEKDILTILEP